ncbi:hypothetical protein N7539_000887 [Penicillium diatomitis]|uniref:Uncharacterized protein n=1 Tax=Penicillium diatomitis TaxID=2819901 RepID=A0A9W9XMK2_9EURO|nr:uncharacterized protein N7539_000887 [Penicillium diatomitis]KAJ5495771.1 hypothetical protein N7539_000887 [Penicillium diatomitis]
MAMPIKEGKEWNLHNNALQDFGSDTTRDKNASNCELVDQVSARAGAAVFKASLLSYRSAIVSQVSIAYSTALEPLIPAARSHTLISRESFLFAGARSRGLVSASLLHSARSVRVVSEPVHLRAFSLGMRKSKENLGTWIFLALTRLNKAAGACIRVVHGPSNDMKGDFTIMQSARRDKEFEYIEADRFGPHIITSELS